jgi:hypothetical protein
MTVALALLKRYWLHLLVLGAVLWALWEAYGFAYQNGYNAANVRAEKVIGEFAKAEAEAQAKAREIEHAKAAENARIAAQYEKDKADAQAAYDRDVSDLRAGNLKLRHEWATCATDSVSAAGRSAAELDAAAAVRERLAAEIIRLGAEADAQVRGLQRVIEADREPYAQE